MNPQLPPHDLDAERFLIGSLIRDQEVRSELLATLTEADLYPDAHQKLWRSINSLYGDGKPIDLVSLANDMKRSGWVDDIGGYEYIARVYESTPTAFGWEHHARIVKGHSIARQIIHGATTIIRDCFEQARDPDDILCDLQRLSYRLGDERPTRETHHIRDVVTEVLREIDKRATSRSATGVASGLIDLDSLTGGFRPGELCLIAARPSVGKTALAVQVAKHSAESGVPSLIFSLEQARGELVSRLLAGGAQVDSHMIRTGRMGRDHAQRIGDVANSLRELPLWINDSSTHRLLTLSSIARGLRSSQGIGLVIVDYLQLLEPDDRRSKSHEQTEALCRGLKILARELSVPIICLTQLNRNSEHRENNRPRLCDLRDAGEQPADTVIALWRPADRDEADATERVDAVVLKQRNGPIGEVSLLYLKSLLRFENMCQQPDYFT